MNNKRIIIIFAIIIWGRWCKYGREWLTPNQSKDPSPIKPAISEIEEKEKIVKENNELFAYAEKKTLALLLIPASVRHHRIQDQQDR